MKRTLLAATAALALSATAEAQTLGQAAGGALGLGNGVGSALGAAGSVAGGLAGAAGAASVGSATGVLGSIGGALPGLGTLGSALGIGQVVHDPLHEAAAMVQWGLQLAAMARQFEAIAHATSVAGIAGAAGGLMNQRLPLPGDARAFLGGNAGTYGAGAGILQSDRYYALTDDDPTAREMRRRETVSANAKALAEDAAAEAQAQLDALTGLQAEIEASPDGTANAAQANALVLQRQKLEATRLKLDQVRLLLAADDRVSTQRAEQMQAESADALILATQPIAGSLR